MRPEDSSNYFNDNAYSSMQLSPNTSDENNKSLHLRLAKYKQTLFI